MYRNEGQFFRFDGTGASAVTRVRKVNVFANGHWLQSNTGTISYSQGNVVIGGQTTTHLFDVRGTANVGALSATSITMAEETHSTSKDTGAIIVSAGGLGVEANVHSTNVFADSHMGAMKPIPSSRESQRSKARVERLRKRFKTLVSTSNKTNALINTGIISLPL